MISAIEAIKAINQRRNDAIVVSIMTPSRYWAQISENPELDLPIFGAMGKASSVALGLALAQPDKKILVLDGDGSLLMNLGSMVTVASQQPKNFIHFVFEDGEYFTTGGQPVPGAGKFNLAAIAEASGYLESYQFDDFEDFVSELPSIFLKEGPIFISLKVVNSQDAPGLGINMGNTRDSMRRIAKAIKNS